MDDWVIEPYCSTHDRTDFACNNAVLDNFLRVYASQYEKRGLGRTFVAVSKGSKKAIGYYTIASSSVAFETLPRNLSKRLPRHPIPVILLARLAVDKKAQGQGLGRYLLTDAFMKSLSLSKELGVCAIAVDAIDGNAAAFYMRYGFVQLLDNPHRLYLPLETIKQAFL